MIRVPAAVLFAIVLAGCSPKPTQPLGPSVPSGTTIISGDPMKPSPTAAAPRIPASHQEAQDTLTSYLQKTVNALPPGTSLDGSRYGGGDGINYCEDNPADTNAPVHVEDWFDMKLAAGSDFNSIVAQTGDIWKGWGWRVSERDGFTKPNRFGYAPDGYTLQIMARDDPKYAPSLIGSSPCFPGTLRNTSIQRPALIEQHS
jgi:hypothetical protein